MADRQRVRRQRYCAVLLRLLPQRLPPVAPTPVWIGRRSEPGVGDRVLEPGVLRLAPGAAAAPAERDPQPESRAGIPAVRVGCIRRLSAAPDRSAASAGSQPVDHDQSDARLYSTRLRRPGAAAGFRLVGQLPALEACAGRASGSGGVHTRPDARLAWWPGLLDHGGAERSVRVGNRQEHTPSRRDPAVDLPGGGPRSRWHRLLPLANVSLRRGGVLARNPGPRRAAEPPVRGSRPDRSRTCTAGAVAGGNMCSG